MNPPDLKYSREHEWVRMEADGRGVIGITAFAVESLGDIVFLDLPETDTQLTQSEQMGEVESVKAVSELYSPVSGRVVERNQMAIDGPEAVNDSPYESGWLLKVELSDAGELDKLMTSEQYEQFLTSEAQ